MKLDIPPGKYVAAVSGGVDSMVLLDLLAKQDQLTVNSLQFTDRLVVAHFNHGMRQDSDEDEELVKETAAKYRLPLEVGYGKLGPNTSEEKARTARYKFLNRIKRQHKADAVITAHHQDDLIETAIINTLRGTGRRGLTAISNNRGILRPLLHIPKRDILDYARQQNLVWRGDPTNADEDYLRNYVRLNIVPKMSTRLRRQLLAGLSKLSAANSLIDQEIANLSQTIVKNNKISRNKFIALPNEIAKEVLMYTLRNKGIRGFDKKTVDRLCMAVKTAKTGSQHDISKTAILKMTASEALLVAKVKP